MPVVLPEDKVKELLQRATDERLELTVDLDNQTISDGRDAIAQFDIEPFVKYRLMNGLDDIGLTLQHEPDITAFEAKRRCRVANVSCHWSVRLRFWRINTCVRTDPSQCSLGSRRDTPGIPSKSLSQV